jgi:hypothetical protein
VNVESTSKQLKNCCPSCMEETSNMINNMYYDILECPNCYYVFTFEVLHQMHRHGVIDYFIFACLDWEHAFHVDCFIDYVLKHKDKSKVFISSLSICLT